jgi:hypothetical protein
VRQLVVLVPQLYLLQDRERDRIDKDKRAVNARCVDDEHLLIGLLQAQEARFGVVERVFVIEADEVFTALIGAHCDALLREGSILLYVPNFENPVGVDRVNATRTLVNHHIDDVVVLQGWSRAEAHWRKRLICSDVVLLKLVLRVEEHDLTELVVGLERLARDTL